MRFLTGLVLATSVCAQPPAIRTGGVVNAASHIPSTLAGGAIARGALIEIAGVRLGDSTQTTTVTVSAAGTSVRVPLTMVTPQRIEGRLPVNAPLGEVSLTVSARGLAGAPFSLRVVRANFGIYSRNGEGWGPGRIRNPANPGSPNSLQNSAQPGQSIAISGTGLGGARPEVWVGARAAPVESVRRGTGPTADEITFRLAPDTPQGCHVPLQVRQPGGEISNTVTLAVRSGGGACEPSPILPVAAWGGNSAGLVLLSRTSKPIDGSIIDEGMAVFASQRAAGTPPSQALLLPPAGTCTAYTGAMATGQPASFATDALMSPPQTVGRDAGPRISVSRGNLRQQLPLAGGRAGAYRRILGEQHNGRAGRLGPLFLEPGELLVSGAGGVDVGPFSLPVPAPAAFEWENREFIGAIDRRAGVALRWKPLKDGAMLVSLVTMDASSAAWGASYCVASASDGGFTIPPAVLANLPTGQASLALSYVAARNQVPLQATGIDHGLAISIFTQALDMQLR